MSRAWVLDTPALTSFARGSIYMAALLRSVTDQGTGLLVPATCLMEAHARADDPDLVDLLCGFRTAHVVPLDDGAARSVGTHWRTGTAAAAGAAHSAWLATRFSAPVVTDHSDRFAGLLAADHPIYTVPID